ncbi:hypothetical protein DPMN_024193, partial [Dreissena polymorpha]
MPRPRVKFQLNNCCRYGDVEMENAPQNAGLVFQQTGIIFKLVQDIIGPHLLTKFHECIGKGDSP